ncbi:MAG: DUF5989 family protein [Planctomycetota bacterium]
MGKEALEKQEIQPGDELESGQTLTQEFFTFLKENKIWWITPTVLILLVVLAFIILTSMNGNSEAPFVYTLF